VFVAAYERDFVDRVETNKRRVEIEEERKKEERDSR
jgi:hypothetical protein